MCTATVLLANCQLLTEQTTPPLQPPSPIEKVYFFSFYSVCVWLFSQFISTKILDFFSFFFLFFVYNSFFLVLFQLGLKKIFWALLWIRIIYAYFNTEPINVRPLGNNFFSREITNKNRMRDNKKFTLNSSTESIGAIILPLGKIN